jgi:hypothetical protein
MFSFFFTQYRPLHTRRSEMEYEAKSWFPAKLRLTQATITITTATMMYKASTLWLRSYKAYMRMINMAISNGKYNWHPFMGFRNEWTYNQRRPESQGLGIGETIASHDSWRKIWLHFFVIYERQRWIDTNIWEAARQYPSTSHQDWGFQILTSVLFELEVDQKYSSIIGIWPKNAK